MSNKIQPVLSRHCIGTIITKKPNLLLNSSSFVEYLRKVIEREGVRSLGEIVHEFPNKSYTVVVALAESHIAIHTWPERHTVQLDVFLCNYANDNTKKCKNIFDAIVSYYSPIETNETLLERL
jgi:S-adenosylmethionine decarboxylase